MITPSIFDELHASRKEHCTCGAIMAMPNYHDAVEGAVACPYREIGEGILKAAEAEVANEEE